MILANGAFLLAKEKLKKPLEEAGIKLDPIERYTRTDTSVTGQILKITSANPDAVLVVGSGSPAALPQLGLVERGATPGILEGVDVPCVLEEVHGLALFGAHTEGRERTLADAVDAALARAVQLSVGLQHAKGHHEVLPRQDGDVRQLGALLGGAAVLVAAHELDVAQRLRLIAEVQDLHPLGGRGVHLVDHQRQAAAPGVTAGQHGMCQQSQQGERGQRQSAYGQRRRHGSRAV
mgnify:CR=1 FL=1